MRIVGYTKKYTVHVSKVIGAPLRFAYDWCTDYQDTDPGLTGSKAKREVLFRTRRRVVYTETYVTGSGPTTAVDVVTLYPPQAWHLDYIGDEDDETGEYLLTFLTPKKTLLDMTFVEHYKIADPPSKETYTKQVSDVWDKYVAALEKEYRGEGC